MQNLPPRCFDILTLCVDRRVPLVHAIDAYYPKTLAIDIEPRRPWHRACTREENSPLPEPDVENALSGKSVDRWFGSSNSGRGGTRRLFDSPGMICFKKADQFLPNAETGFQVSISARIGPRGSLGGEQKRWHEGLASNS